MKRLLLASAPSVFMAVVVAAALLATPALADQTPGDVYPLPAPIVKQDAQIPQPLSLADSARYKIIFEQQGEGNWSTANEYIKALDDKILMGHVQAQRYLSRSYKSSYAELSSWLKKYSDHPQASKIYDLAIARKPAGSAALAKPPGYKDKTKPDPRASVVISTYYPPQTLSASRRRELQRLTGRINYYLRKGGPTAARKILNSSAMRNLADPVERGVLQTRIAAGYWWAGKYRDAWDVGKAAAENAGSRYPYAHWIAGISAWRLRRYEDAAAHFEAVVRNTDTSDWTNERDIARAAFWAARVHWLQNQRGEASRWLQQAASFPRNFYGQLAHRALGTRAALDWQPPALTPQTQQLLLNNPVSRRGLALLQAGESVEAETDMKSLYKDPVLAEAVLALAHQAHLPNLGLRLGNSLYSEHRRAYDFAMFPETDYQPLDGLHLDKALLHAFMHQESAFHPGATSWVGARGLMQLMPATAQYMSRGEGVQRKDSRLYEPEFNMMLGQRYIRYLIEKELIQGNTVGLAASYNGGIGNLGKWLKNIDFDDDPLLFIESIPNSETRDFVQRINEKLWIYRQRFNQPTPTLDALIDGKWPRYKPLDNSQPPRPLVANAPAPTATVATGLPDRSAPVDWVIEAE